MPNFTGFQPQDFEELKGSTWRGQKSLGGALARTLRDQLMRPFESWGVNRRLELHIAYRHAYNFYSALPYAKLFVYTWNNVDVGFYIETPGLHDPSHDIDRYVHWRNFRDRLQTSTAFQTALLSAMTNHSLVMTDFYREIADGALGCEFRVSDGRMQRRDSRKAPWIDVRPADMFRRLSQLPEDKWVDLHIYAHIKRQQAIDMGPRVVDPILKILRALAPVYDMTVAA